MSKGKHSEVQIIAALKQVEAGRKVEDLARECRVSKRTIYAWKSKYGGMDVSEAQEVKQLREENARPKKLVADLSLNKDMLQSGSEKTPRARREESGSAAPSGGVPHERAPHLRTDGDSAHELPISIAARRPRIAGTAAGSGARETTLRLSAVVGVAGARSDHQ
jgi:putative transposase